MSPNLDILHVLRAPVGGLFRHVCDLATEQARRGHRVGVICAADGDALTAAKLGALAPQLALGLHRLTITRSVGWSDLQAIRMVRRLVALNPPDVVHGHGAKGGAYARLAPGSTGTHRLLRLYTPHGGSLHYDPATPVGRAVAAIERALEARTDGLLFESAFAQERYRERIGPPRCAVRVVPNGVGAADLEPLRTEPDAADVLFIGELRYLKGVDILLQAAALVREVRPLRVTVVGDGPDRAAFETLARNLGLGDVVTFTGARPAAAAMRLGRIFVLPSRAESLPYAVLEAGGRGLPVIATAVGGIPHLAEATGTPLVAPGDPKALAAALLDTLADPAAAAMRAAALRARIGSEFTIGAMTEGILGFYRALLAMRRGQVEPPRPIAVGP